VQHYTNQAVLNCDNRSQVEEKLQETNRRFDAALRYMSQGLCMFDQNARLLVINDRYHEIYGLPIGLAQPGISIYELLQINLDAGHFINYGFYPGMDVGEYFDRRRDIILPPEPNTRIQKIHGDRSISVSTRPLPEGGWVLTFEDVTERSRAEARIIYMARHDSLTGLANRVVFNEQLSRALLSAGRTEDLVALLCLDLDGFKKVNDSRGHPMGDALLCHVSERLSRCARETDTVARLGGDEFALLLNGIASPADAAAVAQRVVETLAEPYVIEGYSLAIGASVGIAIAPQDGVEPVELIRHADMALYRVKHSRPGGWAFYSLACSDDDRTLFTGDDDKCYISNSPHHLSP
jgi:diguanylate cyclase (GGDEF)-like protein